MKKVEFTDNWLNYFTGSSIGILQINNVDNTKSFPELNAKKKEIEQELQEKFNGYSRQDLLELDVLKAYRDYYKKFDKTYHVLLQLESIIQKKRNLPNVSPLVDSNFAAELQSLVLTAGHDVESTEGDLVIDITKDTDSFVQMNGKEKTIKANDMCMKDDKGIICTIIYGQDNRTPITKNTNSAIYVAYAPNGVSKELVEMQLSGIKDNVMLCYPEAEVVSNYVKEA